MQYVCAQYKPFQIGVKWGLIHKYSSVKFFHVLVRGKGCSSIPKMFEAGGNSSVNYNNAAHYIVSNGNGVVKMDTVISSITFYWKK